MTDLKPADSVALFDSTTAMVAALAAALRGEGFPHLGSPSIYGRAVRAAGHLPWPLLRQIYTRIGAAEGVDPARLGDVDLAAVARWLTEQYPRRRYPAALHRVQQRGHHPPRGRHRGALAARHRAGPGGPGRRPESSGRRDAVRRAARPGPAAAQPRCRAAPHARPGAGRADGRPDDLLPDQVARPARGVRGVPGRRAAARRPGDRRRRPVELAGGPGRRAARVPARRAGRPRPGGLPSPAAHPDRR